MVYMPLAWSPFLWHGLHAFGMVTLSFYHSSSKRNMKKCETFTCPVQPSIRLYASPSIRNAFFSIWKSIRIKSKHCLNNTGILAYSIFLSITEIIVLVIASPSSTESVSVNPARHLQQTLFSIAPALQCTHIATPPIKNPSTQQPAHAAT